MSGVGICAGQYHENVQKGGRGASSFQGALFSGGQDILNCNKAMVMFYLLGGENISRGFGPCPPASGLHS